MTGRGRRSLFLLTKSIPVRVLIYTRGCMPDIGTICLVYSSRTRNRRHIHIYIYIYTKETKSRPAVSTERVQNGLCGDLPCVGSCFVLCCHDHTRQPSEHTPAINHRLRLSLSLARASLSPLVPQSLNTLQSHLGQINHVQIIPP